VRHEGLRESDEGAAVQGTAQSRGVSRISRNGTLPAWRSFFLHFGVSSHAFSQAISRTQASGAARSIHKPHPCFDRLKSDAIATKVGMGWAERPVDRGRNRMRDAGSAPAAVAESAPDGDRFVGQSRRRSGDPDLDLSQEEHG
jgi:hypothetical protein